MYAAAVDDAVDLLAGNALCAHRISITQQQHHRIGHLDDAMYDECSVGIFAQHNLSAPEIFTGDRPQQDGASTPKEGQHALSADADRNGGSLLERVAHDAEDGFVIRNFHALNTVV